MSDYPGSSILFTPLKVGTVEIPNRFVRSATHDFMAGEDGSVTERQVALFRRLAEGEAGLIITGHAYVNPAGKAMRGQNGVDDDSKIEGLRRVAQAVHNFPSRLFLQVSHAGRQTKEKICGCTPLAPSAVFEPTFNITPREMTEEEIERTVCDFIQAARRAKEAEFDGIQLHVAHGYLLSSFISPHTNRREDAWGGSTANRTRIVVKILRGIKTLLGEAFTVIIKLNSSDFLPAGLHLEESAEIARILVDQGVEGIEVSGGMTEAGQGSVWKGLRPEEKEGYFVESAGKIKKSVSVPVFGLGGIRTFAAMEKMVEAGKADLVSMCRPFIREPHLLKKFRAGEIGKSECISCNKCFNPRGIRCGELPEEIPES